MSKTPLNDTSFMPQMGIAFSGWGSNICISKVVQYIHDGLVTESTNNIEFSGTVQPLSPKLLMLKPENLRAFEWLDIHCFSGRLDLDANDVIFYKDKKYKVMGVNDYSNNNFIEYHAIEDYHPRED